MRVWVHEVVHIAIFDVRAPDCGGGGVWGGGGWRVCGLVDVSER